MRTLTLLALTTAVLSVPAFPAWASADSCQGHTATHVGTPGGDLVGTPERDVVVTNGAASTVTGDGDDLVCVTGDTGKKRRVKVGTGNGADEVHVTADDDTFVVLGAAEDVFEGGPQDDSVFAGILEQGEDFDEATDRIDTGGGADGVVSGSDERVNGDVIDLGDGDDFASISGTSATGIIGGDGDNILRLRTSDEVGNTGWLLNARDRTASRNGITHFSWTDFDGFDLTHLGYELPLQVVGSPRGERFLADGRASGSGPMTLDAGGGGDLVTVSSDHLGKIGLGAGRDRLEVFGNGCSVGSVTVGLGAGQVESVCDKRTSFKAIHVEDVLVSDFGSAAVRGTENANTVELNRVCSMNVLGKEGSDVIRILGYFLASCGADGRPSASALLQGSGGNDVLVGGRFADRLIGGPGRDVARGNAGRDLCRAEVRRGCERG